MLLTWTIIFIVLAILLGLMAFGGIAIAISYFTKILFLLSLICFLIALILILVEKLMPKKN